MDLARAIEDLPEVVEPDAKREELLRKARARIEVLRRAAMGDVPASDGPRCILSPDEWDREMRV